MNSDHGDYIGQGVAREFDHSNASVTATLTATAIGLAVSGGTSGSYFNFNIAPASGQNLVPGYYTGAQRTPFRTAGHPGIDIFGDGRGCNEDSGAFEVRDIAYSGPNIRRLDLLYEQHCEGGVAALFGEIQVAEPYTSTLIVSSNSITWPSLALGALGTAVPVYLRNLGTAAVSVGAVKATGHDQAMFTVVNDGCSSLLLTAGGSCAFYVSFKPSARGPRNGRLEVPLDAHTYALQLDGSVQPGTTSFKMVSQPGDWVGQGLRYSFSPANAVIAVRGSPYGLHMSVNAADGQWWDLDMYPASGQILAPGTYPNATRYPFNGSGNGLSVVGDGRGCNTLSGSFTVKQAVFSAIDNSLQHFEASFVQHCESVAPALSGTLDYAKESVTTPPPGVSNLTSSPSGRQIRLTWVNPTTGHYAFTVIRLQPLGAVGSVAFSGTAVYAGRGTVAMLGSLKTGSNYTVTAFTVDTSGNVGPAQTLTITGP